MGNSEVGHLNIGAGRVVMQDLPRITDAIASHEIEKMPALNTLIEKLKVSGGTCHMMGLVSDGGVHSHQDHAAAIAHILASAGIPTLVHAFTDGRDTPPRAGQQFLARFMAALPKNVAIATVDGRYYAMDRDKRWERVKKAYDAIVEGEGAQFADPLAVVADSYAKGRHRRIHHPGCHRRLQGHAGRRRHPGLQLPRRPHPRNPHRHPRSGLRRLCAQASGQDRGLGPA